MIEFRSISKSFAGANALRAVSFSVARGECHAVMGENGAGKSTLGRILAGVYRPDAGEIVIDGKVCHFHSPRDAARLGIGMVHQEVAFCPDLSVAENLSLGCYPRRGGGFAHRAAMEDRARRLLAEIGVPLEVRLPMRELSTGQVQMVQVAAAVGSGARILMLDEPTSSLSEAEAQRLFALMHALRARGVTMIYVSHRLPEVMAICDRVSVLRDGAYVGTLDRADASRDAVVRLMIGRAVEDYFPAPLATLPGRERLRVADLSSPGRFEGVTFSVHAGEIVGLAGLVGAGRSDVAQAIFGLDRRATGTVAVDGEPLRLGRVREALRRGIGLVPEDRKRQGLIPLLSCTANFSLAILERLRRWGLLDRAREAREAAGLFDRLRVKTSSLQAPVTTLSGGNQQKVVLARWLALPLKVLIVDEPTRGVDVGAKATIHRLLDDLARQGLAILLISSELPEVVGLCSRVVVMRAGRICGELSREDASQEKVLRLMAGVA